MLTVPTLKPGEQPFSPELQQAITFDNAVPADTAHDADPADATPEQEAKLLLDHTILKDLLTTLHQELDSHFELLARYSGANIAAIPGDHDKYLVEQIHKHKNSLKDPQQRHLFDHMTRDLFEQSKQRALMLYLRQVRQYRAETVERQNAELVNRALAEETIFDDQAQTRYRDMILFNLETLYQDVAAEERHERLEAASAALYRKIMDGRLERDPGRLEAMLAAPAVRRALGEAEAKQYDAKVKAALADLSLRQTAREWADRDIQPEEAQKRAAKLSTGGEALLAHYNHFRANKNEKAALTHILDIQSAWAAVKEGGYRREAIPAWVVRNRPALYTLLCELLAARLGSGGAEPEPDYSLFLKHMTADNRPQMWEELADEATAHSFVQALGGVESWAFDVASRKILVKTTPEDTALAKDLLYAKETFERLLNDHNASPESENRFLALVQHNRREKMRRLNVGELLFSEMTELVQLCVGEFYA